MMIGSSLNQYQITARVGAGGMGEVFRARDTRLNRDVAVKVLPKDFVAAADRLRRFEQEAKTLAALNHPNVLTIHDAGVHDGAPYLVSELLEGKTLREEMNSGTLPVRKATEYALQIAHGLAAANGKGVIHRDLKPENIFVTKDGRVKILDFGLAKLKVGTTCRSSSESGDAQQRVPTLADAATIRIDADAIVNTTEPGMVLGTPAYMSPEQVRGEAADHRADIFAFGCVLYEMLSGTRAFRRNTPVESMSAVLNEAPPELSTTHPNIPLALARIVERCLEKQPDDRFQSAKDLAFALSGLAAVSSAPRSPTGEPVAVRPAVIRFAWPALAAVLSVSLAVVSVTWWRTTRTPGRASQIRSLAVLPFAFETQDPKLAGLGKWIPAEIRSKLGPLQNLQVVNSPARIEQLVQQKKSEVEIARELGVDGLVMGELHGQGETMSAYVWVVDGATGRALGRQREIAASASKVSEIPNQVALAIVDELKLQISTSQRAEIQVAETQNSESFLAFQKGRDLLNRRLFDDAAVELLRAYRLDTNYTRAWTALSQSEWVPLIYGGTTNEVATTYKRLSSEVERFRAQRPDDPALASLRMWIAMNFERDWNKVRTIFWESQRNPKPDSEVLQPMSWYYTFIEGHPEHAWHAMEQAIALAPENLILSINRGYQLFSFGRYDDALRAFRSLPPEKIQLEDYSRVLLMAGDLTGAKEVATRVLAGRPNAWTQCHLAAIHAKSGAGDEARKILRELEAQAEQGMHIPYAQIAWSYGMLGDFESARRWLRTGLLEGHGDWSMLTLRFAEKLQMFGKLAWYWEIIDEMKFPPLQMDNPYFALEQAMRYGRGTAGSSSISTSTSTNEAPKTLAVLPFVNMSADKDNEYFSDGITEEILNALARTPGLRVAARTSAFSFKGKNESVQRIGEMLKVGVVLEGSVRRAGNQLRITAKLVNVADEFLLWSDTFDRKAEDVFAIQTEVAQRVQEVLKVKLLAGGPNATLAGTDNLEAYDLYLRGRHFWDLRTGADLERAVGLFRQATEKDPKFAAAYAWLASSYVLLPKYAAVPVREANPKARAAARRALELDGRLAEAHAVLGHCALKDWDWVAAEQEFQEALRINPNHSTSRHWNSMVLLSQGKWEQALAEIRKAQAVDPLSAGIQRDVAEHFYSAGRYDEALVEVDKALKLSPDFLPAYAVRGRLSLVQKNIPEAIAEFEKVRNKAGDTPYALGSLGHAYARAGRTNEARQILEKLKSISASGGAASGEIAFVNLGLGDLDQTCVWLERAVESRDLDPRSLKVDPLMGEVVKDPRYAALLKKFGLDK